MMRAEAVSAGNGMRALIILVIATTACGELVSSSDAVNVALPAQTELIALIHGVEDAASRVAPALSGSGGASVSSALNKLTATLNAADGPGADRALSDARAALVSYRASSDQTPADGPELSSIEIALDRVDGQLQRLCTGTVGAIRQSNVRAKGFAASVSSQTQGCSTK